MDINSIYPLTFLDQSVSRKYVYRIFTFPYRMSSTKEDKEIDFLRINDALKAASSKYPALRGHFSVDVKGNAKLVYSQYAFLVKDLAKDFATLVIHDKHNYTYQELCDQGMPVSELTSFCPMPQNNEKDPSPRAFHLYVNFVDGGLILCFAFQHTIVDGTSICLFMEEFARNRRGLRPSMDLPKVGVTIVNYRPPDVSEYFLDPRYSATSDRVTVLPDYDFSLCELPKQSNNSKTKILVIRAATVDRLKGEVTARLRSSLVWPHAWVSKVDCLGALAWISIMRARADRIPPDAITKYGSAVNVRDKLNPPLQDHYFGNMFNTAVAEFTLRKLTGLGDAGCEEPPDGISIRLLTQAALQIRESILAINDDHVRRRLTLLAQLDGIQSAKAAGSRAKDTPNTGVSSGSLINFGADLDFGIPNTTPDGTPQFCRKIGGEEDIINFLPRRGRTSGDADWEIQVTLREKEMVRVCKELHDSGWLKRAVD